MHILEIITCSYIRQKIVLYMCVMLRVADLCFVLMLLRDFKFARDAFHVGATMASSGSGNANRDPALHVPKKARWSDACPTCGRNWPAFREPWRGPFRSEADTRAGQYCRTVTYCLESCPAKQWFCSVWDSVKFMQEHAHSTSDILELKAKARQFGLWW